jgi:bis(5'-nucleosidyl)-tetraphosphatase
MSVTLSAGVVIVRFTHEEPQFLLLRAYRYWDFPKGRVEPGEAPLAAAIREVEEETALTDPAFRWGEDFTETASYGNNKIARYYLAEAGPGEVHLPINPELGHPEHDEFRWLAYGPARALLVPRVAAVLDWAHARVTATPRA